MAHTDRNRVGAPSRMCRRRARGGLGSCTYAVGRTRRLESERSRSRHPKTESQASTASFVVVANRLPVDRVENADGSVDWRTSPGGLVTAFEPVMRSNRGAWVGWHGASDEEPRAVRAQRARARAGPGLRSTRSRSTTRASPTPPCGRSTTTWSSHPSTTGSGGTPTSGQPALRGGGGRGGGARGGGLGPGLPAPAGAADAARAAAGPADRLLPAHPVPADRALPAASVARTRSSKACSAPTWSDSSCPAAPRTSSGWSASGSTTRPAAITSGPPTAGRCWPARTRSRSTARNCTTWP